MMLMKMRAKMQRKENQKGFTLIELVIVMAILAILAALAIPRFSNVLKTSREHANEANIKLIQDAVDLYAVDKEVNVYDINWTSSDDVTSHLVPTYLKEVPKNPKDTTKSYKVEDGVVTNE